MKIVNKKGFKIAVSGVATQAVLVCHGGWVTEDGTTTIPSGMRLCFYAGHGHYTIGPSVYSSVIAAGKMARNGLMKQITMSDGDIRAFATMIGKSEAETRAMKLKEAVGVYDSFGGGMKIFDYALSREPKGGRLDGEKKLFKDHSKGAAPDDIDMIVMDTTKTKHLSDLFEVIGEMGYSTLHFGACRVSYGVSPSEVAST